MMKLDRVGLGPGVMLGLGAVVGASVAAAMGVERGEDVDDGDTVEIVIGGTSPCTTS